MLISQIALFHTDVKHIHQNTEELQWLKQA